MIKHLPPEIPNFGQSGPVQTVFPVCGEDFSKDFVLEFPCNGFIGPGDKLEQAGLVDNQNLLSFPGAGLCRCAVTSSDGTYYIIFPFCRKSCNSLSVISNPQDSANILDYKPQIPFPVCNPKVLGKPQVKTNQTGQFVHTIPL